MENRTEGPSRRGMLTTLAAAPMLGATTTLSRADAQSIEESAARVQAVLKDAKGTQLVLLGTGAGPVAGQARSMTSYLMLHNGSAYVLDCGLGVTTQYARTGFEHHRMRFCAGAAIGQAAAPPSAAMNARRRMPSLRSSEGSLPPFQPSGSALQDQPGSAVIELGGNWLFSHPFLHRCLEKDSIARWQRRSGKSSERWRKKTISVRYAATSDNAVQIMPEISSPRFPPICCPTERRSGRPACACWRASSAGRGGCLSRVGHFIGAEQWHWPHAINTNYFTIPN